MMRQRLGNYIIAAFFINIVGIISIGGICILLVKDMAGDISRLKAESRFVSRIHDLNSHTHEAIFLAQNSTLKHDIEPLNQAISIVGEIDKEVSLIQHEKTLESRYGLEELVLFQKIKENIVSIQKGLEQAKINFNLSKVVNKDLLKRLEDYGANIQNLIQTINTLHFRIIERQVNESNIKMYYILFIYVTSCLLGIVASCAGYILLTRNVIMPIIGLASATEKVAAGDLSVRVRTNSKTEIGTLYNAFNTMTERLQEHERRREHFSRELEKKVQERTSELKASEESLRRAQDDLIRMEKIATLGQIATSVNHEIKTPLNVLYMNLQLLNKRIRQCSVVGKDEIKGMLNITGLIDKEVARINEIIEEFVRYARFPLPDIKENNLNKIVEDLAGMISQKASEANVSVELSLDSSLGTVMVDDKKITQALLNLCMNAIQAMANRGGRLLIKTKQEKEHVVIVVSDTGTGIPPENIRRIFDPFFTNKEDGMGFGLAIVQRIVEDHRGRITCHSQVGKGTSFEIHLPIG